MTKSVTLVIPSVDGLGFGSGRSPAFVVLTPREKMEKGNKKINTGCKEKSRKK